MDTNTTLLAHLPTYLKEHDKLAAVRLVQSLTAYGFVISVDDGEELTVRRSMDAETILKAMGSTDNDHLYVYRPLADGKYERMGMFWLVWGNSPGETIADHTANDFCEEHYKVATAPWPQD